MAKKKNTVQVYKFRYRFITSIDGKLHIYTYPYWVDPCGYRAGTVALMISYIDDNGYIPDDENRWKVYPLTAIASIEIEPIAATLAYSNGTRRYEDDELVEEADSTKKALDKWIRP